MNKKFLLISGSIFIVGVFHNSFAAPLSPIACAKNPDFSKNTCDVCFENSDATVSSKEITITADQEFSWKNTTESKNQIFYKDGQKVRELISNYGTAWKKWVGAEFSWPENITWGDIDGQKTLTLEPDKSSVIVSIKKDTKIPIENYKASATGWSLFKIPVTYYELDEDTFERSEAITKNYCVSYISKMTAPATENTVSEDTDTEEAADETTVEDTVNTALSETVEDTEDDPADTVPEVIKDEDAEEDIPSYDANVALNSAGTDPSLKSATNVETGPEEIFILFAACLLGILLYPKVNQIFQKN